MLCLVSGFIPFSELSVKICALLQDPNDAIATLVDDSIWSIFSQAVSGRQIEVQQDALTFICSRGCSFDDFCSMFDDLFVLYEVVKGQGELHPLLHVLHSLFLISEGILRLARTSVERVTEVTWLYRLFIILPWLNEVDRTLGIENYGCGFLVVRGFVGALYSKNCSVKANFISKPMMICSLYLGCSLHLVFTNSLQNRGSLCYLHTLLTYCTFRPTVI